MDAWAQAGAPDVAPSSTPADYDPGVSASVQLGLVMSLCCALGSIVGFLYKHRGAVEAPDVEWRHPFRSSIALFSSKWYTLGIVVALGSWFFHVAALALAPISLVQTTIAGGLVLLTVVADRMFGFTVTKREWIGVALVAIGLAFLAATLGSTGDDDHSHWQSASLATYVVIGTAGGLLCVAIARGGPRDASILAVSAGLTWGASDVSIKALSGRMDDLGIAVLVHPLAFVILVLSLVGLLISARSLQLGDAIPVIAVTSATANVFTVASGPIVFSEPFPDGTLDVTIRILAFALVIAAAALTPPPVRAAEAA